MRAMKPRVPRPTDTELSILRVLWDQGPSTVRQVHEHMAKGRTVGYTTTLKLLQIMTEKGLVTRSLPAAAGGARHERSHVYEAKLPQDEAQRQLVGDLLDRAFGGSAATLVMQALASRRTSDEELEAIRRLIAKQQEKTHGPD
jgi:predicted transcriptional regulator